MADHNKQLQLPDLTAFMAKRVQVKLKGGRLVSGELRGVDAHMNLVLHNAVDESKRSGSDEPAGIPLGETVIRGTVVVEIVGLTA